MSHIEDHSGWPARPAGRGTTARRTRSSGEPFEPDVTQAKVKTVTVAWLILIGAGLLEVVWAIALKESDGFTKLWPSVIGVATAWISFILLSIALKSLPVGTAYAVWVGIGAVGVVALGIMLLNEGASLVRLSFLAMITIGIVGLRLTEG
jgi:quaternary ammonium compound-resistance protein SugE